MKKRYMYRDGEPRMAECQFQHLTSKRSSGHYGTGVYAYRDKERAEQSCKKNDQCYEIDITDLDLYKPDNLDDLIDLGIETEKFLRSEYDWDEIGYDTYHSIADKIKRSGFGMSDLYRGITKAKECRKERKDFSGLQCSMPINHILMNYDGVEPKSDRAANANQFGMVIFKEAIEKKLRTKFGCLDKNLEIENIPIGEKF